MNVLSYYNPLRELIRNGVKEGFIASRNEQLIIFVDGPEDLAEHENFDWGKAALGVLEQWREEGARSDDLLYDWTQRKGENASKGEELSAA